MAKDDSSGVVLDAEVKVSVGELAWEGKLSALLRINRNNINGEMARQPELVSWFGVVAAEAIDRKEATENQLEALEDDLKILYADLDLGIRSKEGTKLTEKSAQSMVISHPRYREHVGKIHAKREELRVAQHTVNKVQKILIAFEHKKDMLIQLSANDRKELLGGGYDERK